MPRTRGPRPNAIYFGEIIHRLRLERGWNIATLAYHCQMHPNYISALEKGRNTPSLETLLFLADVFNVDPVDWVREISDRRRARLLAIPD